MREIEPAEPSARRRALVLVLIAALVGASLISSADQWSASLLAWLSSEPADRVRLAMSILAFLIVVPLLVLCAYLWRVGSSVIGAQRFPPSGMRVVRDTIVVRGERAVLRGRLVRASAVVLAVGAALVLLALWRFVSLIATSAS